MSGFFGWVLAAAVALVVLVGLSRRGAGASEEARRWLDEGATLLDVRTEAEFSRGHPDGALNIPVQDLEARVGELDADRPVVVYCASGNRSRRAADLLSARGFERVLNAGPMSAVQ